MSNPHIWQKKEWDENEVDEFAYSYEFHNGPRCTECGYSYCVHCSAEPKEDCPGWEPSFPILKYELAELYHAKMATVSTNWFHEHAIRGNLWEQPIHAKFLQVAESVINVLKLGHPDMSEAEFRIMVLSAAMTAAGNFEGATWKL